MYHTVDTTGLLDEEREELVSFTLMQMASPITMHLLGMHAAVPLQHIHIRKQYFLDEGRPWGETID